MLAALQASHDLLRTRHLFRHRPRADRIAEVSRNTAETRITVRINLDGTGQPNCTRASVFDHMLDQIARHGLIDLDIDCAGDLHIDGHHTVEDVASPWARRLRAPWATRRASRRYGHALRAAGRSAEPRGGRLLGRPGLHLHIPSQRAALAVLTPSSPTNSSRGLCEPRGRDAAHRQPQGHQRPPPVRDGVQGFCPRTALCAHTRSARGRHHSVHQGQSLILPKGL